MYRGFTSTRNGSALALADLGVLVGDGARVLEHGEGQRQAELRRGQADARRGAHRPVHHVDESGELVVGELGVVRRRDRTQRRVAGLDDRRDALGRTRPGLDDPERDVAQRLLPLRPGRH